MPIEVELICVDIDRIDSAGTIQRLRLIRYFFYRHTRESVVRQDPLQRACAAREL